MTVAVAQSKERIGAIPSEVRTRRGSRIVELFIPISKAGRTLDSIEINPPKLDHTLRWLEKKITKPIELLSELTGLEETMLRELTYPDANRVMSCFMDMLPDQIRADIDAGNLPVAAPAAPMQSPFNDPLRFPQAPQPQDDASPGFDYEGA